MQASSCVIVSANSLTDWFLTSNFRIILSFPSIFSALKPSSLKPSILPSNFSPIGNEEVAKVYRALPNGGSLMYEEASSVPIITNTKFYSETVPSICENLLVESFTNNINLILKRQL